MLVKWNLSTSICSACNFNLNKYIYIYIHKSRYQYIYWYIFCYNIYTYIYTYQLDVQIFFRNTKKHIKWLRFYQPPSKPKPRCGAAKIPSHNPTLPFSRSPVRWGLQHWRWTWRWKVTTGKLMYIYYYAHAYIVVCMHVFPSVVTSYVRIYMYMIHGVNIHIYIYIKKQN